MKKKTIKSLALLGLANGLLAQTLIATENFESNAPLHQTTSHVLAKSCGASKCSSVAKSCGASKCSSVAKSCGASKCSSVAKSCGASGCSSIAERDLTEQKPLVQPKTSEQNPKKDSYDPNSENMGYHLLTEDELMLQLNDQGAKQFRSLSPEGKKLALLTASQMCQGTNECRGLNACQTDKNKCQGQGSCKGQSKCAHADKNVAVKLVAEKMAGKRSGSLNKPK